MWSGRYGFNECIMIKTTAKNYKPTANNWTWKLERELQLKTCNVYTCLIKQIIYTLFSYNFPSRIANFSSPMLHCNFSSPMLHCKQRISERRYTLTLYYNVNRVQKKNIWKFCKILCFSVSDLFKILFKFYM